MQIIVNRDNEIIAYALQGGMDNSITVEIFPDDFFLNFKPKYYLYENGNIVLNINYKEDIIEDIVTPSQNFMNSKDEELRNMFASMQVQLVQANTMVMQLSQQNAQLSQELVKLNQEIENLKGENKDEDVIPEV